MFRRCSRLPGYTITLTSPIIEVMGLNWFMVWRVLVDLLVSLCLGMSSVSVFCCKIRLKVIVSELQVGLY